MYREVPLQWLKTVHKTWWLAKSAWSASRLVLVYRLVSGSTMSNGYVNPLDYQSRKRYYEKLETVGLSLNDKPYSTSDRFQKTDGDGSDD